MMIVTYLSLFLSKIKFYRLGLSVFCFVLMILTSVIRASAQTDTADKQYQLLYDKQSETELTESIGYLNGDKLLSTPSAFISNGFTGRIAGLYTRQNSGEPGHDGVNVTLRRRSPLVLVDGIPRNIYSINPEQIESITVLKDALSTAMLGVRGMDGAVLITTKKGLDKKGFHLDVKAQTGISSPLKLPDPLSAYDYTRLYNEALKNDGLPPLYSPADLEAYEKGTEAYTHPNINWYDKILKKQAPFSRFTLDAEGANERVKYFVSLDYLNQKGLFKDYGINTYSTNTQYQRYIFRSNVAVDLTSKLSMSLNVFGQIASQNEPGKGAGSIMSALLTTPNNAYPVLNPDSSLGGNFNYKDNIYGQLAYSGYKQDAYRDGYADLSLKRRLDDIVKGWWVKGTLSYHLTLDQRVNRSKSFEVFQMQVDPRTGDTTYHRYGNKSDQNNSSTVTSRRHEIYAAIYSGYSHHWGDKALDILMLYNLNTYTNNSTLPNGYKTVAGQVRYNIKNRYILQAAASYSGNNRHEKDGRFGFFPAVGAAWNIQNEPFFNKNGFFNKLKLRATFGLNGNSVTGNFSNGYYQYINHYTSASGYYFGASPASASGLTQVHSRNVNTWEKGLKLDVGLDMNLAKNRGWLSIDYYHNKLTDLVHTKGQTSALLGWGNSIYENLGEYLYSGLEITAGWTSASSLQSPSTGSFNYYVSGNLTFSDTKVLFIDEPDYPYSWMQRTGLPIGQTFGYVSDGYITEAGQGPVMVGYQSVPGDLKYKDLNNDGVINEFDRKPIGTQKPLLFYGVDFGFSWKNFRLGFLIQGVANRDIVLTGDKEWAFQNNGKGQAYRFHLNRWTPGNGGSATFPRLTVGKNVNNNVTSTYWLYSGNYVRLKNAELSYEFKNIDLGKVQVNKLRLFINGLNLLTVSDLKQSDPETLLGSYPIQRVVNGGIFVQF